MSVHPNDIARRSRVARLGLGVVILSLMGAFFNAQVLQHDRYKLQSQENRLRALPLPAPRGIIYDRSGNIIAENLPGYAVSIAPVNVDSLKSSLKHLSSVITLTPDQVDAAIRRFRRDPNRPTLIISDASMSVVSVLEEHRINFPRLIIQSVPKRFYPDGPAVASFVGYTGEVTDADLNSPAYQGYKPGQLVGKGGIEKEYEKLLRGKEGVRYDEVDARGRQVRQATPRLDLNPEPAPPLYTNIDLDLQRYVAGVFGDSLVGGAIAIDPRDGGVLALYSAPSYDVNKFTGGIPADYWKTLLADERRPLVNKVTQGRYPPGSTFKLATAVTGLEDGVVTLDEHMPEPCTGGFQFGNRYFKCWDKKGHGSISLGRAIEVSCDVYFYQLGLKIGLSKMIAGGVSLDMREKTGIDLPDEKRALFPYAIDYYNKTYGARGWSNAVTLNLSIGQGENSQTVVNMAKFYTALATDGNAATPEIVKRAPVKTRIFRLDQQQMDGLRTALAGVIGEGTATSARIQGIMLAGKTGTAQTGKRVNGVELNHAWFVGFAPADKPTIVVAVMLEYGGHGGRAAHVASSIISHYLKVAPVTAVQSEG
ncbi:MAG TPA: penicillin-binding protein 2 [Gemmatimonadaceae bacterium]